jgi:hypothetical protein
MMKAPNGRFFKQYFIILCINQMASALFRFMAALGRNVILAGTVGSFALLAVQVLGGFVISRGDLTYHKSLSL